MKLLTETPKCPVATSAVGAKHLGVSFFTSKLQKEVKRPCASFITGKTVLFLGRKEMNFIYAPSFWTKISIAVKWFKGNMVTWWNVRTYLQDPSIGDSIKKQTLMAWFEDGILK